MKFISEVKKNCCDSVRISAVSGLFFCTIFRLVFNEFNVVNLIYDSSMVCGILLLLSTLFHVDKRRGRWIVPAGISLILVLLCICEMSLPEEAHVIWKSVIEILLLLSHCIWTTARYFRLFGSGNGFNQSYDGYAVAQMMTRVLLFCYYVVIVVCSLLSFCNVIRSIFLNVAVLCLIVLFLCSLLLRERYVPLAGQKQTQEEKPVEKVKVAEKRVEKEELAISTLYDRFRYLMEEKRPYLSESCLVEDIARDLFTNKTYLSKMVNDCTGMSFPKLINQYRVEYSMELYKKDMHLKVSELAEMSGFHSTVTFNMAFKCYANRTPSEWCREYRASHF